MARATRRACNGEDFDGVGMAFQPVVDGVTLEETPIEAIRDGSARGTPVLVGTTAEEWKLFSLMLPDTSREHFTPPLPLRRRAEAAGRSADELLDGYTGVLGDATPLDLRNAVETDRVFRIPAIRLAEAQVANGGPSFMYRFDWRTPLLDGRLGACHALELPFVFDTLGAEGADAFCGPNPPQELADAVHAAWVAFAHTGDPSHEGIGAWPRYDLERRATMLLDVGCRVADDPGAETRRLWDGIG